MTTALIVVAIVFAAATIPLNIATVYYLRRVEQFRRQTEQLTAATNVTYYVGDTFESFDLEKVLEKLTDPTRR